MSAQFDPDLHKRFLSLLLSNITKSLASKIAFKGGTCAYFFFNLPRFSIDLDFDMLKEFTAFDLNILKEVLSKNGRIRDNKNKEFTLFFLFDYGKGFPNIKIEFNKRVWKNNAYIQKWFLGLPLIIQDEASLLTNKMIALTDRKLPAARDLYDTHFFLKQGFPINDALIKERTGKEEKDYLSFLSQFIKKTYTPRNVLQGLGELLDPDKKLWAKNHLIPETVNELSKRKS